MKKNRKKYKAFYAADSDKIDEEEKMKHVMSEVGRKQLRWAAYLDGKEVVDFLYPKPYMVSNLQGPK